MLALCGDDVAKMGMVAGVGWGGDMAPGDDGQRAGAKPGTRRDGVSESGPMREAVDLLRAGEIDPLTRPRVLAAARAIGAQLSLAEWYRGAWDLERGGGYVRGGTGDGEWLEPVDDASTPAKAAESGGHATSEHPPIAPRLLSALIAELGRVHDVPALLTLAQTATSG